ncbi:MAG: FMN-binding protein, partial [Gorillibacterium sp.]|nr:FMN-binding protein [Gorillibacterium sp.]
MKKTSALVLSMTLVAGLLAACGDKEATESASPAATATAQVTNSAAPAEAKYADGVYYAQGDSFDVETGWKDTVALKVEGDKITAVNWNGLHKDGGIDKKETSVTGKYGMKAGGASSEWHEQAALAEAFLIDKQDPAAIVTNAEGKTDAIAGVSIHVAGLTTLATKALAAGPVEAGIYKDGTYHAEAKEFDAETGWKDNVTVTVVNGKIFAVLWNGLNKDGGIDKKETSVTGKYGMKAGGASSEWHEQTAL